MRRGAAAGLVAGMGEAVTRIGIGGWSYPPWRGNFYPAGLPQRRELEYASRQFGAIEINATFYGRQSPESWQATDLSVLGCMRSTRLIEPKRVLS